MQSGKGNHNHPREEFSFTSRITRTVKILGIIGNSKDHIMNSHAGLDKGQQ